MRLLLAAALALASASALGQDAPAAAEAIQDFYAAAANKDKDCPGGAIDCGFDEMSTLDYAASCRQAAQWRDLGRNYQGGDAELIGKYKDALSFWSEYCSFGHSEWSALDRYELEDAVGEAQAAEETEIASAAPAEFMAALFMLGSQCAIENDEDACTGLQTLHALTGCLLNGYDDACKETLAEALETE